MFHLLLCFISQTIIFLIEQLPVERLPDKMLMCL
jgi:hypothetical protein